VKIRNEKAKLEFCVLLISLLSLAAVLAPVCSSLAQGDKKVYRVEEMGKDKNLIRLIPELHLVPPGSNLVHKEISLKDMEKLKDGKKLQEKAMVDVKFFKEAYEKDFQRELTLKEGVFNVYQDFHDYYTDPAYFVFQVKEKK